MTKPTYASIPAARLAEYAASAEQVTTPGEVERLRAELEAIRDLLGPFADGESVVDRVNALFVGEHESTMNLVIVETEREELRVKLAHAIKEEMFWRKFAKDTLDDSRLLIVERNELTTQLSTQREATRRAEADAVQARKLADEMTECCNYWRGLKALETEEESEGKQ